MSARRSLRHALLAALLLALAGLWVLPIDGRPAPAPAPVAAQAPTPTPAPTAALPDLSGEWSITRRWYRSCPGCGAPVSLTSRWTISQTGALVQMRQGPRGELFRDGAGAIRMRLEGLEQAGPATLRFFYDSLRVAAGGTGLEGGFAGSERIANPCADRPPVVTCFVNAGWLSATRLEPGGPGGAATPAPTATNPPSPSSTPRPPTAPPPAPSDTATPASTPAPSQTPAPTASDTPPPTPSPTSSPVPLRCYLPLAWR